MSFCLWNDWTDEDRANRSVRNSQIIDATQFRILKLVKVGRMVVVKARYDSCANFEGLKILVYENCTPEDVMSAKTLDPHFCNVCALSPIARFIPTRQGCDRAVAFAVQCQSRQ
jgi:hypothetical protein